MLESLIKEASLGIRSFASKIARRYDCIITSTLDVHLNAFPTLPQRDNAGLVLDLSKLTTFALRECRNYSRVVGFVAEEGFSGIIGVTASGRPRILLMPAVVNVRALTDGRDSIYSVSAVGIYSLRAINRRVRFGTHSISVPYKER